ncbi:unnamed protein product [Kuraishia capsulata CBS 1993]|uniref:Transcription factor n=1 Tax=Kuraishia capsulata CBS 1993 TaxID=1382522 RepID=W6MVZ0_9ASCO|nr:uncharacterized protein KUCA_T00002649001 [Kuraishia capsulata CBS 1993]CDK26675.1 unnamed protein product [Kuraishia capsulata CBS 1993]
MSVKQETMDDIQLKENPGSTDFVKKLFQMLEDDSYKSVVRWTDTGDSFIVIDTNEFTKEILPKHFKHSNFASFVRQLNKYDFHKVKLSSAEKKNIRSTGLDESTWEFKHPDFRAHDIMRLENIKRKAPLPKRPEEANQKSISKLEKEIGVLKTEIKSVSSALKLTQSKYNTLVESFVHMKSSHDMYASSISTLASSLVAAGIKVPPLELPQTTATSTKTSQPVSVSVSPGNKILQLQKQSQKSPTVEHTPLVTPNPFRRPSGSPIHVLLVEDDVVCIQLCRKFLMKYGCTVEVVTDGLGAISIVEKVKFDLVLMDIVMPNLDGATASSIIRSFDSDTPIIAMTGNVQDSDLRTYLDHGMTDILAKPFSKDDLYQILEKHHMNKRPLPIADPVLNGENAAVDLFQTPEPNALGTVVTPVLDPVVGTVVSVGDIIESDIQIPKRQRI